MKKAIYILSLAVVFMIVITIYLTSHEPAAIVTKPEAELKQQPQQKTKETNSEENTQQEKETKYQQKTTTTQQISAVQLEPIREVFVNSEQHTNGTSMHVTFDRTNTIKVNGAGEVRDIIKQAAGEYLQLREEDDIVSTKIDTDTYGNEYYTFQQTYKDVPLHGTLMVVRADEDQNLRMISGRFESEIELDTTPLLEGEQAISAALQRLDQPPAHEPAMHAEPSLQIHYDDHSSKASLIYRSVVEYYDTSSTLHVDEVLVDAHEGHIIDQRSRIFGASHYPSNSRYSYINGKKKKSKTKMSKTKKSKNSKVKSKKTKRKKKYAKKKTRSQRSKAKKTPKRTSRTKSASKSKTPSYSAVRYTQTPQYIRPPYAPRPLPQVNRRLVIPPVVLIPPRPIYRGPILPPRNYPPRRNVPVIPRLPMPAPNYPPIVTRPPLPAPNFPPVVTRPQFPPQNYPVPNYPPIVTGPQFPVPNTGPVNQPPANNGPNNGITREIYQLRTGQNCVGMQGVSVDSILPGQYLFGEDGPTSRASNSAKGVFENMGTSYWYFKHMHGRKSWDDKDRTLTVSIGAQFASPQGGCTPYNAQYMPEKGQIKDKSFVSQQDQARYFPDKDQLIFGGDNNTKLTESLDLVAHEYGHGVTMHGSQIGSNAEGAAMNEAYSDIFAAGVEAWSRSGGSKSGNPRGGLKSSVVNSASTWQLCESCGQGFPRRYLSNPAQGKSSQHRSVYYYGEVNWPTRTSDRGNPHANGGILTMAFYLTGVGGTHPEAGSGQVPRVQVDGIGMEKALKLFYSANAFTLGPKSKYKDARNMIADAAVTMREAELREQGISTNEACNPYYKAVHQAFDAVGVPGTWKKCN